MSAPVHPCHSEPQTGPSMLQQDLTSLMVIVDHLYEKCMDMEKLLNEEKEKNINSKFIQMEKLFDEEKEKNAHLTTQVARLELNMQKMRCLLSSSSRSNQANLMTFNTVKNESPPCRMCDAKEVREWRTAGGKRVCKDCHDYYMRKGHFRTPSTSRGQKRMSSEDAVHVNKIARKLKIVNDGASSSSRPGPSSEQQTDETVKKIIRRMNDPNEPSTSKR